MHLHSRYVGSSGESMLWILLPSGSNCAETRLSGSVKWSLICSLDLENVYYSSKLACAILPVRGGGENPGV